MASFGIVVFKIVFHLFNPFEFESKDIKKFIYVNIYVKDYIYLISNQFQMNIIEKAGILAIGTRLLRVHDQLRTDANAFYKAQGFDFETKWFPVMYVLSIKSPLSIMEIAAEIGLSHPTTITLLRELENRKYIESIKDERDERKRNIQLTSQGLELVNSLRPIWKMIIKVLTKLTTNQNNLFQD